MNPDILKYAADPEAFKALEIEDQLSLVADIILHYAQLKTGALREAGKTRVDSCIEAQEFYDLEKYWERMNQNIKKVAEMETARLRSGV